MQALLIILLFDDIFESFGRTNIEHISTTLFLLLNKMLFYKSGRASLHRSPDWGCIPDAKILKFQGGKSISGKQDQDNMSLNSICGDSAPSSFSPPLGHYSFLFFVRAHRFTFMKWKKLLQRSNSLCPRDVLVKAGCVIFPFGS